MQALVTLLWFLLVLKLQGLCATVEKGDVHKRSIVNSLVKVCRKDDQLSRFVKCCSSY